jgi:flagellar assembly factor FliW
MAPVVLNVKTRQGLQAIRRDQLYSHQHLVSRQGDGVGNSVVPRGQPC